MDRKKMMKIALYKKMKQQEADEELRTKMKEYAMKQTVNAKIKRQETDYNFQLDRQKEDYKVQRERQKDRAELEDPTAKWKTDVKKDIRRQMGGTSEKPSFAALLKEKQAKKIKSAEVFDIDESQLMIPTEEKKHFWSKTKAPLAVSNDIKRISAGMKTIGDVTDFLDNINKHRNQYGEEGVNVLLDYVDGTVIPKLNGNQLKYLEEKGYIEEK